MTKNSNCCQSMNGACQTTAAAEPGNQVQDQARAQAPAGDRTFRPGVDIIESAEEYTIVADVPGSDAEGIEANFEDGVLTIRAAVPARSPQAGRWLVREYGIGPWERTFRIGEGIDPSRIAAVCRHGVLTLTLPKAEHARARRIEVRSN